MYFGNLIKSGYEVSSLQICMNDCIITRECITFSYFLSNCFLYDDINYSTNIDADIDYPISGI